MATPNLYLGLQVSSASNHTIQESVPFNVRFGHLPYYFLKILKSFQDYPGFQLNFEPTIVLIGILDSEKL